MISIIIPVYNSEKYLDKCIDGILTQSFSDFELLLVDDGSTDRSGNLCDEYAAKDKRIRVIHKENGGPSAARNTGSLASSGEYITFVDSDDYIDDDYLEILYNSLISNAADISTILITEIEEDEVPVKHTGDYDTIVLNGHEAILNLLYQKDLDTYTYGMLFKRQIILDNPFPVGRYHEDDFTTFKYFEDAEKIVVNKCIKYYYVQHASSIMHSGSSKIIRDEIDAANYLVEYFKDKDADLLKAAKSKKFSNYCQIVLKDVSIEACGQEEYDSIISYLKSEKRNVLFDKNTRFKNKAAAFLLYFGTGALKLAGSIFK